ncbi:MAG: D-aminoacyl-tRNA deacylase [Candidatus Bathyarchaeia archaeon]|jgi:D-aminoacyl-tRNA deacylase
MILLVSSNKDPASLNIKEQILKNYIFQKSTQVFEDNPIYKADVNGKEVTLVTLNRESVTAQDLPQKFPAAKFIVFISRHSSQSGKPTLSVHTPGNFATAELGGLPKTVSVAPAAAMQTALKALCHYKEPLSLVFDYEVSYECTHHGPSLNVPTMFVELGSSPAQWSDVKAAEAVAHSAMTAIATFKDSTQPAVLGIGGTHYNQKFTTMALVGEAAFGHMVPKYAVSLLDEEVLRQCVEKTLEQVPMAVLDWKGIRSEDKPALVSALEKAKLPYRRV